MAERPIAAMDLGTNSFHLVVVQPDARGRFEILTVEKDSVRLGSGGGDLDLILPDAMERGLSSLKRYAAISRSYNAEIRAVATSAVREAKNSPDFLTRVKKECDLDVEVIPGKEEARLIYLGVLQCLPVTDKRILTIDIGGGSTEYLIGKGGVPEFANSLKLGAIRLKDRFFPKGTLSDKRVEECRQFIRIQLTGVKEEIESRGFEWAVGSSGTIETVWEMIRLKKMANELTEALISRKDLDGIVEDLLEYETAEKRMKLPGLDDKRADIIVGGAILLQESFRMLGIDLMHFSKFALREGVVLDTLQRKSWKGMQLPDIRRTSVDALSTSFQKITPVAESGGTAKTALALFDGLHSLKPDLFPSEDRFLLESAARLHNIGMAISHGSHHKHSYYIIKNSDMLGFTPLEIEIIGLVARYHRKGEPKQTHPEFAALGKKDQGRITRMTAVLRVAIGLGRLGDDLIESLSVRSGPQIIVELKPARKADLSIPVWAAKLKSEMLQNILGAPLEFVTV